MKNPQAAPVFFQIVFVVIYALACTIGGVLLGAAIMTLTSHFMLRVILGTAVSFGITIGMWYFLYHLCFKK